MARRQNLYKAGTFASIEALLDDMDTDLGGRALSEVLGKQVAPYLKEKALGRFESRTDPDGKAWTPLSDATESWRGSYHYESGNDSPNKRTGKLEDFIRGALPSVLVTEDTTTLFYPGNEPDDKWTAEKYRTAQRGKPQPKTPPRPIIGLNQDDYIFIETVLEAHINGRGLV